MRLSGIVSVVGALVAINCHAGLLGGIAAGLLVNWVAGGAQ
jgi:hypothetical protein